MKKKTSNRAPRSGVRWRVLMWGGRLSAVAALIAFALVALCVGALRVRDPEPAIRARHGHLVAAEVVEQRIDRDHVVRDVRLTASSGLVVALKVKFGRDEPTARRPLLLILAGFDTGRDAVELVDDTRGTVLAALSYPVDKRRLRELGVFRAPPVIRDAVIDSMAAPLLALDYLLELPEVDPARVDLLGVSLGGPFACVAGALDKRFSRVWSIHSGGRIDLLLQLAMQANDFGRPGAFVLSRLVAWAWNPVAPEKYVGRIAPRPFILVNGRDDDTVPEASIRSLYDSAGEPKTQEWLPGRHIHASRRQVLAQMLDLVDRYVKERPTG